MDWEWMSKRRTDFYGIEITGNAEMFLLGDPIFYKEMIILCHRKCHSGDNECVILTDLRGECILSQIGVSMRKNSLGKFYETKIDNQQTYGNVAS